MLPERKLNFFEFLSEVDKLGFKQYFFFKEIMKNPYVQHNQISIICTHEAKKGANVGSVCMCCTGYFKLSDYDEFKECFSRETYDTLVDLMHDFTFSPPEYKNPMMQRQTEQ